jgi:hypothetical protein
VLPAEIRSGWAETPIGALPVASGTPDGRASIVVRTDALRVDPGGPIAGRVVSARFRGADYLLDVAVGEAVLQVAVPAAPPTGTEVRLGVDPSGVVALGSDDLVERGDDLVGEVVVEAGEEDRPVEAP